MLKCFRVRNGGREIKGSQSYQNLKYPNQALKKSPAQIFTAALVTSSLDPSRAMNFPLAISGGGQVLLRQLIMGNQLWDLWLCLMSSG